MVHYSYTIDFDLLFDYTLSWNWLHSNYSQVEASYRHFHSIRYVVSAGAISRINLGCGGYLHTILVFLLHDDATQYRGDVRGKLNHSHKLGVVD